MNQQIAIAIVIICIFATFGTTYAVVTAFKDQEITDLKAQYELDITNLNTEISNKNAQITSLNNQIDGLTVKNEFYGIWWITKIESNKGESYFPPMIIINSDKTVWTGYATEDAAGQTTFSDYWTEGNMLCFEQKTDYKECYHYRFEEPGTGAYDSKLVLINTENENEYAVYNGFNKHPYQ